MRTSLVVMIFATGLAIILSLASVAHGYHASRTLAELSRRTEEAEKKVETIGRTLPELSRRMGDDEKRVEAIETTLQNFVPTDGSGVQH